MLNTLSHRYCFLVFAMVLVFLPGVEAIVLFNMTYLTKNLKQCAHQEVW